MSSILHAYSDSEWKYVNGPAESVILKCWIEFGSRTWLEFERLELISRRAYLRTI